MLTVGITGGIASGKSTVRRTIARTGRATLDLDEVAHRLLRYGGAARDEVRDAFMPGAPSVPGPIDRGALAEIVFGDGEARERLNSVMHPRIRQEELAWLDRVQAAGLDMVFVDGALLIETGGHLRFDRVLVVSCDEEQQIERQRARDQIPRETAEARLGAQMPAALKERLATDAIDNRGTEAATEVQVAELLGRWVGTTGTRREAALGRLTATRAAAGMAVRLPAPSWDLHPLELGRLLVDCGLDLSRLADALGSARPWWAGSARIGTPAVALVPTLGMAILGERRCSPERALAAAAALAVLVHGPDAELESSRLVMEAVLKIAQSGSVPTDWTRRLAVWSGAATGSRSSVLSEVSLALDLTSARQQGSVATPLAGYLAEALGALQGDGPATAVTDEALQVGQSLGLGDC